MSEYMKILKMIEDGEISPDEGANLLQQIGDQEGSADQNSPPLDILARLDRGELSAEEAIGLLSPATSKENSDHLDNQEENRSESPPTISDEELERWKQWWTIPLYVGVGIVVLSTFWINSAYQNSGYGFWFFCSWLPLTLGVLLMVISWRSRTGPWIHVRVNGPNERVAVSIPAPLGLAGWALRTFGHYIPHLEKTSVDEILMALEQTTKNNAPLYIHVDDGEDGEQVDVFIG